MFATMSPSFRNYSRRNALVPLPLLPPVPQNAIVTSVKIVHNTADPVEFDSAFTFQPYTAQSSTGVKRGRTTRRRSMTCPPCDTTTTDCSSSSLLNPNRKPRSTIIVTVRLANPTPTSSACPSILTPAPRRSAAVNANIVAATSAMLARKAANKPRVSSPLALSVVTAGVDEERNEKMDAEGVSPLSSPVAGSSRAVRSLPRMRLSKKFSKKGSKGKTTSRIGMLRWAVLNSSSPEVGRRILAMGVRLAKEIWEAERAIEEIEVVEEMEAPMSAEEQDEHEDEDTRVKVAEECIRELEEMEVDSEDTEMDVPAPSVEEHATEESTKAEEQTMEVDVVVPTPAPVVPAPVTTVVWAPKPLQVQFQLKIAVQVFSSPSIKKARKESEKSKRWFERIAL